MSTQPTLGEIWRRVMSSPKMYMAYCRELIERKIEYRGRNNMRVGGKKVGKNRFSNAQKYAAQFVYNNRNARQKEIKEQGQLTLSV